MKKTQINLVVRIVLGALFFIGGFTYSNTAYFQEYPLFGVVFLAEFLLALMAGLFGFYLLPRYFLRAKAWIENLIVTTIYNLVSDFWNQYSSRMERSRKERAREKQKKQRKSLKERLEGGVLIDTSILIDGRILEIAKTGFITSKLIIPKFVINELHLLSDSDDVVKRKKGRRGLDMINDLKEHTKVTVFGGKVSNDEVDKELVKVAKDCKLSIMTLDFNLNKVASVSNIKVLNINELVEALKPAFVPGDELKIKIAQKGKEKGQGVGYLEDGTMIIVSDAAKLIGEVVEARVSKLIQSPAGKLVFCELVAIDDESVVDNKVESTSTSDSEPINEVESDSTVSTSLSTEGANNASSEA